MRASPGGYCLQYVMFTVIFTLAQAVSCLLLLYQYKRQSFCLGFKKKDRCSDARSKTQTINLLMIPFAYLVISHLCIHNKKVLVVSDMAYATNRMVSGRNLYQKQGKELSYLWQVRVLYSLCCQHIVLTNKNAALFLCHLKYAKNTYQQKVNQLTHMYIIKPS